MGMMLWFASVAALTFAIVGGYWVELRPGASESGEQTASHSTDRLQSKFLRSLAWGAAALLVALVPLGISPSIIVGDAGSLPSGTLYEAPEARWLIALGPVFPQLPLNVTVGKGVGGFGLRFDAAPGAYVPPAALYWTPELNGSGKPTAGSVFLGLVGGTRDCWVRFHTGSMRASGYWVLYAYDTNSTMYYQARYSTKERHDE